MRLLEVSSIVGKGKGTGGQSRADESNRNEGGES